MSEPKQKTTAAAEPKRFGWMAEYKDENALLVACRKVRDSGYTKTDAFTPFPVHGIDEALGIKPTILPFIVLVAGFCGLITALTMEIWMNAIDYPYIISGKPFFSIPAFIPVGFELTILFSAFTSFLGMIALNRLPKFSNPVFTNPKFDRATNDRFFLHVDSSDKYYNSQSVKELLEETGPESLDEVVEDNTPTAVPRIVWMTMLTIILASLSPAMVVLIMRNTNSENPRFHVFFDMDFQPKKKPQQTTTIFADGRIMRPQVPGTVARGQLAEYDSYNLGYEPSNLALADVTNEFYVSAIDQEEQASQDGSGDTAPPSDEEQESDDKAASAESAEAVSASQPDNDANKRNYLTEIPIDINEENMRLGQQKFKIYCSACHGLGGDGNGLVHKRAEELAQGNWQQPTSMHAEAVRAMPVGQLFYTIGNGKGKMAGYGPSITPKERWAITMYIRALQTARNGDESDLTDGERSKLSKN